MPAFTAVAPGKVILFGEHAVVYGRPAIAVPVQQVRARAFVVAGSTCESTRLLLNSKSTLFPDGLANSSGVVGRYLVDSVGSDGAGYFPQLERMPPHNHDGVGGMHMYMPWWKFARKNDFLRGYHIEFGGGRSMPHAGHTLSGSWMAR